MSWLSHRYQTRRAKQSNTNMNTSYIINGALSFLNAVIKNSLLAQTNDIQPELQLPSNTLGDKPHIYDEMGCASSTPISMLLLNGAKYHTDCYVIGSRKAQSVGRAKVWGEIGRSDPQDKLVVMHRSSRGEQRGGLMRPVRTSSKKGSAAVPSTKSSASARKGRRSTR
jgi:hypothetical protein